MKTYFLQALGRYAQKSGRGSSIVGYLDEKLHLNTFKKIDLSNVEVVFVTGTNGKTSIVNLINEILKKDGKKVISNLEGANLISGIKTSLIMNAHKGKLDCDILLLEVDEKTVKPLAEIIKPQHVILSNFFRDQLDRYFEISLIVEEIMEVVTTSNAKVYYNSQDPYLYDYIRHLKGNEIIDFRLNSDETAYKENENIVEIKYCPVCSEMLDYKYYHYAHIGDFSCPNCSFAAPRPTYDFTYNHQDGEMLLVAEKSKLTISIPKEKLPKYMLINLALISSFLYGKVADELLSISLTEIKMPKGRNNNYQFDKQNIYLNLAKNVAGMEQTIKFIADNNKNVNVLIAFNDNHADGKDVSWIWDVNFKPLINQLNKLYIVGTRREDMRLRFLYDDFENVECYPTIEEGLNAIFASDEDFSIITNYTPLADINETLQARATKDIDETKTEL